MAYATQERDNTSVFGFAFNRKKIKYGVMNALFEERILDTSVTLFIDMRYVLDIMKIKYYEEMIKNEFVKDSNRVIAEIFNLVAHYKRYFVEKQRCDLSVVLMFDANKSDKYKNLIIDGFEATRLAKTVKPTFLGFIADKMARISQSVPDLYVINSGEIDLSVIPFVYSCRGDNSPKYNVFITNDPLIQQYSCGFKGFFELLPGGDDSRVISTNGFFRYVFEKNKYAVKEESEMNVSDSFVPLYLNLIGSDDLDGVNGLKGKKKKAIDLINSVKKRHSVFTTYDVMSEYGFSAEDISVMKERAAIFDIFEHCQLLSDADIIGIDKQFNAANKVSRDDFDHFNANTFDNLVEVSTLFM